MIDYKLITISSSGYEDYTLNLVKSLENFGEETKLNIYCLDQKSYNLFNNLGLNTHFVDSKIFSENLKEYGTIDFNKFMYFKMKVVHDLLKEENYVFYIDSDVVFKKNLNYFDNYLNKFEILSMKDFNYKTPNTHYICAGFMIIKSNIKTRKLFNPKKILSNKFEYDDQHLINKRRKLLRNKYLETNLFCNGSYFLANYKELDPIAVHFNFITGDKKKETMKQYGYWFID